MHDLLRKWKPNKSIATEQKTEQAQIILQAHSTTFKEKNSMVIFYYSNYSRATIFSNLLTNHLTNLLQSPYKARLILISKVDKGNTKKLNCGPILYIETLKSC